MISSEIRTACVRALDILPTAGALALELIFPRIRGSFESVFQGHDIESYANSRNIARLLFRQGYLFGV
jgi:hypothetical protein